MVKMVCKAWLWVAAVFVALTLTGCADTGQPGEALMGSWVAKIPDLQISMVLTLERDPAGGDHMFLARTYEVGHEDDADTAQGLLTESGVLQVRYHGEKVADIWVDQTSGELVFKNRQGEELHFARMPAPR